MGLDRSVRHRLAEAHPSAAAIVYTRSVSDRSDLTSRAPVLMSGRCTREASVEVAHKFISKVPRGIIFPQCPPRRSGTLDAGGTATTGTACMQIG